MSDTDQLWWDAQCGEYILGTLRGPERDVFEKILLVDNDARARVHEWEQTLATLEPHMLTQQPPGRALSSIMRKIRQLEKPEQATEEPLFENEKSGLASASQDMTNDLTGTWTEAIDSVLASSGDNAFPSGQHDIADTPGQRFAANTEDNVRLSDKRYRIWKGLALLALSSTLVLSWLLIRPGSQESDSWLGSNSGVFSVLQNADAQSLWVVSTSRQDSELTQVTAIAPPALPSNTRFYLWVITADNNVQAAGPLPVEPGQIHTMLLPVPRDQARALAVSLEPSAESSPSVPTEPILFEALVQQLAGSG